MQRLSAVRMRTGIGIMSMLAIACLAMCAVASADFKWEPLGKEYTELESLPIGMRFCGPSEDLKFDKLPDGVPEERMYGTVAIRKGCSLAFVTYASDGGENPDTIIFDVNGDKDLTNDEKITGFTEGEAKPVTFDIGGGGKVSANVWLDPGFVRIQLLEWLKGTVDLDGRSVTAVLLDDDGTGFDFANPGDVMLLDLNSNGRFDVDFEKYAISELVFLGNEVLIRGKLYSLKMTEEPVNATLTPYSGAQGKLALGLKLAEEPTEVTFLGYKVGAQGNMSMLAASGSDFPISIAVPPNDISMPMSMLMLTTKSGARNMLQFSLTKPLHFEADQTTTLAIGDHEPMTITATQKDGSLVVGRELLGKDGVTYSMIMPISSEDDELGSISMMSPAVRILDKDKNLLAEGAMQYG